MEHKIIFKSIVGSQAYGTATPDSDIDYKGIYIQNPDDLLSFGYIEQINVNKDECYYEIKRFLELLKTANPTTLELLFISQDCILEKTPEFDLLLKHRDKFLTTKCAQSFGGYAHDQIKKAKGLDKKMNWEKTRVERKLPLDFCYVYENGKTMPVKNWLERENLKQEFCGLVALNHFRDCYALYYDFNTYNGSEENGTYNPLGFKGIILEDSNQLRLSSIPKGMIPLTILYYNKDGYTMHCKDYKEYAGWLKNRNVQRYVDVKNHGQRIDSKNLLHCRRLLDMAIEIAVEKTIAVRRPNVDYLLKIRKGEVPLEKIIEQAEEDIKRLDELYKNSGLPTEVDESFLRTLLLEIRYLNK